MEKGAAYTRVNTVYLNIPQSDNGSFHIIEAKLYHQNNIKEGHT